VAKLMKTNHRIIFDNLMCQIQHKGTNKQCVVSMKRNMFDLTVVQSAAKAAAEEKCKLNFTQSTGGLNTLDLWHQRLGHASEHYIRKLFPDTPKNLSLSWCAHCMVGAKKRGYSKHTKDGTNTDKRMHTVMADTCEPYGDTASVQGNRYFFLLMDIHTRKTWVFYGKQKSDFFKQGCLWLERVHNETGKYPDFFITDGGGEFDNKCFADYLRNKSEFILTCAHSSNQNPFIERANGVVQDKCRKLMSRAHLPKKYWEHCVSHVVEINNAMPVRTNGWKSPNESWNPAVKSKTLARTRTFGCEAWYVSLDAKLRKGDTRGRKGIYLGTSPDHKGWIILDLETRKLVHTRDVYFNEVSFPYSEPAQTREPASVRAQNENFTDVPVVALQQISDPPPLFLITLFLLVRALLSPCFLVKLLVQARSGRCEKF
jgi:hypothetical protein